LNYGLRYEKTFLPQPTVTDPNYPATGHIPSINTDFAPRIGIAYSLDSKTVVRIGYGIFYARFLGDGLDTLFLGNGRYQTSISVNPTQTGAPVFPNVVPNAASVPAGTVNLTFADQDHFRNAYTQQGTVAIERQLARDLSLTVSYLWSRGLQLWTSRDLNLGPAGPTVTYTIDNAAGAAVGTYATQLYVGPKPDTRYAHIYEVDNGGQSWYNGLAIQLRKRMSHGFTGLVSYTWSHAIDDANQSGASGVITWAQSNTFAGNYALDKGSSPTDQRHRAVISFIEAPTFTHSNSAWAKYLVNGWELSAITTMASSEPISATISVSGQQFPSAGSMLYTTTLNGTGGWNRVPFYPVSSLDIDRIYRVDARLSRNLPISERFKASLMFEAFDLFNTQYNTGVNLQAFSASGGILKPTAGLGLGNQSQAFPDGTNARRMQVGLRFVF